MIKKAAAEADKLVSPATTGKTLKHQNFQNKHYWQSSNSSVSLTSNRNDMLEIVWLWCQLPLVWTSCCK